MLVAFSPPLALPNSVCGTLDFYLSGPCSRGCRAAWADAPSRGCSGISRLSTVWPLPVLLRAGRERAVPCWGWCGFRAWWRRGVGDDGMPRDCARCECGHGVSLCLRVVLFAGGCAPCLVHGVWLLARVARLVSGGVFCCARRGVPAWLFVCRLCPALSRVAGLLRFVLFVGYCVGVRFVSAPARVCGVVHAGLCGRAFDGNRDCRLFFTV